ncbi:SRPBCC family protein [Pseudomonas benzenivorans]|uniref:SRPBCC family protein n=1 Tax=Pseudomonas benzenivorans TaxID=556533 RepID=A0ABZ0PXT5_9PSED|nr:SRPBCC family protein [Pseudomonas benzenivorans]WPC05984.1 SRPBCC family protein [Pseudomonas benzenivorans]
MSRRTTSMLGYALIALALLLALLLTLVARQPDGFSVERSVSVAAPPEAVFAQVNDLRNWERWSPWAKRDPAMQKSYEGPPAGVGAVYRWAGNKEVGEGSMTLVESRPNQSIRIRLVFLKPFQASNEAQFQFAPEGEGTRVTWSMSGSNNFMAKAMHLVMDMDKMVGGDFEQGLAQLRTLVEEGEGG